MGKEEEKRSNWVSLIRQKLDSQGEVSIAKLSDSIDVSPETLRKFARKEILGRGYVKNAYLDGYTIRSGQRSQAPSPPPEEPKPPKGSIGKLIVVVIIGATAFIAGLTWFYLQPFQGGEEQVSGAITSVEIPSTIQEGQIATPSITIVNNSDTDATFTLKLSSSSDTTTKQAHLSSEGSRTISTGFIPDRRDSEIAIFLYSNGELLDTQTKPITALYRTSVRLLPIDDSRVLERYPSKNYGRRNSLHVNTSSNNRRSFLKFDLSDIPPNAMITKAEISLYAWNVTNPSSPATDMQFRAVDDDSWNEMEITWNNQPAHGGVIDTKTTTEQDRRYMWDVTNFVAQERAGDKIASFCMRMTTESYDQTPRYVAFGSKDTTYAGQKPYLKITCLTESPAASMEAVETPLQEYDTNVRNSLEAWIGLIKEAEKSIYISTFLMRKDWGPSSLYESLENAAEEGVGIKILLDEDQNPHPPSFESSNIQVQAIDIKNLGDPDAGVMHAKYLVIDNQITFVGSQNWTKPSLIRTREEGMIIRSEDIAKVFVHIFEKDWKQSGGQIKVNEIPADNNWWAAQWIYPVETPPPKPELDTPEIPNIESTILDLIGSANSSIQLQIYNYNTYDTYLKENYYRIHNALKEAAKNVDVRMLIYREKWEKLNKYNPSILSELKNVGVSIKKIPVGNNFCYHPKVLIIDGEQALVWTGNLTLSHMRETRDVGVVICKPEIVSTLENLFSTDWGSGYAKSI